MASPRSGWTYRRAQRLRNGRCLCRGEAIDRSSGRLAVPCRQRQSDAIGLADAFDMTVWLDVPVDELERRLVRRWLDHGFAPEQARDKALSNDIPNARRVAARSRNADFTL